MVQNPGFSRMSPGCGARRIPRGPLVSSQQSEVILGVRICTDSRNLDVSMRACQTGDIRVL